MDFQCFNVEGTPVAGWFILWNTQSNMDDNWGYPHDSGNRQLESQFPRVPQAEIYRCELQSFGALGDGQSDNSKAFREAIRSCSSLVGMPPLDPGIPNSYEPYLFDGIPMGH